MTDRYTKIVLTVIAAALVGIVAENAIRPLSAQQEVQRVAICDIRQRNICADVQSDGRITNTTFGLQVLVQNPPR